MTRANFLETILAHKHKEVETQKLHCSARMLRERIERAAPPRSLKEALSQENLAVIAEIKKASPSAGVIREDFDPVAIARSYVEVGANAISMLTDEQYFQGSLTYIEQVRPFAPIPILRKDFLFDPYQLLEARSAGADAILLIVAALDRATLQSLLNQVEELGLDALVEVHSEKEMRRAIDAGANIIGINNRNLETFTIDLATTEQLAPLAPTGTILVGESGLHTRDDVQRMIRAGVDAVLVGTHFMKDPDPGKALQEFKNLCSHRDTEKRS
jgi:indole-3-glycerol phosphate synthase